MSDPIRILIADDHPVVRKGLRMAIEEDAGLAIVAEAAEGEAALALIETLLPQVAVLDVDMPNMSGFELCTKVRTLPQYAKTPVVFVTGLNDLESRANSTMSGGNDFIAKPFLFIELTVKALMHVLRSRIMAAKK